MSIARCLVLALLSLLLVSPACHAQEEANEAKEAPAESAKPAAPPRTPTKPKTPPSRVAAAHVLISHVEAERPMPGVTRSKEEAEKLAKEIVERARKPETKFEDLVKAHSDEPEGAERGGQMGIFREGQLRGPFQAIGDALFGMEVGQIADVVESPYGFHVLARLPIVEYSAAHILIQYTGSERAPEEITRTKEDARKLAAELVAKAKAEGADFAALAREHSEGPSGPSGGHLGIFAAGQMVGEFEKALEKLEIGKVFPEPVETPFGFHVIKRLPIERVGASHILIQYKGSERAGEDITRSKEEAKTLAEKIRGEATAAEADFAALARKYSDGPSGPRGGALGLFEKGQMVPAFDKAVFALQIGEVSGVVETAFGYHVILRTE